MLPVLLEHEVVLTLVKTNEEKGRCYKNAVQYLSL